MTLKTLCRHVLAYVPTAWVDALRRSLGLLFLISRTLRAFCDELAYYFCAKFVHRAAVDNKSLILRKRAHQLERVLFKPHAYPLVLAKDLAKEMSTILAEEGLRIDPHLRRWAERILGEFEVGGDGCLCPLINDGVGRAKSPVDANRLMTLLRQRRSRRVFLTTPLTMSERIKITEASQWAPSTCNRQTIELIFVEEPSLKSFIASTTLGAHQFFSDAPCIVVMLSDARDYKYPEDRMSPFIDGAVAIQNIYLMCEALGLGCCWGSYTSFGNMNKEPMVRRMLGIPSTHLIVGSLAIGRSDQMVCLIPRDPPESRFGIDRFRGGGGSVANG